MIGRYDFWIFAVFFYIAMIGGIRLYKKAGADIRASEAQLRIAVALERIANEGIPVR